MKYFLTCTKLSLVFKTFVLSIFEWLLKTGFSRGNFDYHRLFIFKSQSKVKVIILVYL